MRGNHALDRFRRAALACDGDFDAVIDVVLRGSERRGLVISHRN